MHIHHLRSLAVAIVLLGIGWLPIAADAVLWHEQQLLAAMTPVSRSAMQAAAQTGSPRGVTLLKGLWASHAAQSPLSAPAAPAKQSDEDVARKSAGCLKCHKPDSASMHVDSHPIGCTDCHGGDATAMLPAAAARGSKGFLDVQSRAHVPHLLDIWKTSANPVRSAASVLDESLDFIRFVNPGDLRVADRACGACHESADKPIVSSVRGSMMTHGAMLWGAALYNNGAFPQKTYQFGEFYTRDGSPGKAVASTPPTQREIYRQGILPFLEPLFRWEVSQPGNVLRIFEDGGRRPLETGVPDPDELPGRPANRFSNRGLGTLNRTDPVFIGLQKTRLMDPTLNFLGTNDQAGDYRSSGCTACHVIYANDRSPVHSDHYSIAGNEGRSMTADPMIRKDESGHPIKHVFTKSIPTSQCFVCHMHPGTNMVASYAGLTWWDNETDGDKMYPAKPLDLSREKKAAVEERNPEGSAVRGLWSDPNFLERTGTAAFNAELKSTQFADFHGHGWLFRAVFKRDRQGNLVDAQGKPVTATTAQLAAAVAYRSVPEQGGPPRISDAAPPAGAPVHLKDIHLERGMHCVDCHFSQDAHGNGKLYGETRNAVEIDCTDCHGTVKDYATLRTSGPAAPNRSNGTEGGRDLTSDDFPTPFGEKQFESQGNRRIQRSMVTEGVGWQIPQLKDLTSTTGSGAQARAAWAHTVQKDGRTWGATGANTPLAHSNDRMTCYTCHSSWVTSCFGCHLSQRANEKREMLHNEGTTTRNWTSYNFQVLRDDVFMLGVDGTATGNRIAPVRSSSAVVVSSEDINRQQVYFQQQTVSAEGYAGQAFNTHVPHTVRATETKTCTDCHVSATGNNNAVMAQLLLQGTNFVNFMGRFVYVATGKGGIDAIPVTEKSEPQAVIGSDLHRIAYPREYAEHAGRNRQLPDAIHKGTQEALSVQARGEYLYVADGSGGFRVLDIAQINQKGFSEKIITAPASPIGQNTSVKTRFATAIVAPSTLAVDPARTHAAENQEQPISPVYGYVYITDRQEGLVISGVATLLDGNPTNNFLKRAAAFNPDGILNGAVNLAIAGNYAYILCTRGLVIVDLSDPLRPKVVSQIASPSIRDPRSISVQFRYAFITDADGFKVVDITSPSNPVLITGATLAMKQANGVYVARTYAYVANGAEGLMIVDVERPEHPHVDQVFNAAGAMNDVRDVKVAMTNASAFAYVADGKNGLRVVQLVSSNRSSLAFGFSPRPAPELIATYKTSSPALAISKGLDRDRAVDESGNQIAVFGRRGARPFSAEEMQRLYLRDGRVWTVSDEPPSRR